VIILQSLGDEHEFATLYSVVDYSLVLVNMIVIGILIYVGFRESAVKHNDDDEDDEDELNRKVKTVKEADDKNSARDARACSHSFHTYLINYTGVFYANDED
jgi:hypothetical protein